MLLALDHLYGAVYFHRTVRAATTLLTSALSRAAAVAQDELPEGDPLLALLERKGTIDLDDYVRVNDATVWHHLERWSRSGDDELRFYAERLRRRQLPKQLPIPESSKHWVDLDRKARQLVQAAFPAYDPDLLVVIDEPSRLNYKRYDADSGGSIWTWERDAVSPRRIEDIEEQRSIVPKVAHRFYRQRIYVPPEVYEDLRTFALKEGMFDR